MVFVLHGESVNAIIRCIQIDEMALKSFQSIITEQCSLTAHGHMQSIFVVVVKNGLRELM